MIDKNKILDLKKFAFATAYSTKLNFENIKKGILQLNGTNDELIKRYARENAQVDITNTENLVLSNELQNLQDLLNSIACLGLDVSEITMKKIDDKQYYDHKKDLEKVLMDFIIHSDFIQTELLIKLTHIKAQSL